ncbi:ComF family protein [bacterium]|jgi:competence protein ComFC|nr:ComF family protein [bacterium]MBT6832399.1 ComF family protein [bacterium]MBT6995944.1 ComF family protein [bacterium]MBT7772805.1 ComF family protein [bacterium]
MCFQKKSFPEKDPEKNFCDTRFCLQSWLLDAFFPAKCLTCGRAGDFLCETHRQFPPAPQNEAQFQHLDEIFAATEYYDPVVKKSVEFFKFRGFSALAKIFAETIVERVPDNFLENAILVPIPLHWTRKLWRGFNQADVLARAILENRTRDLDPGFELKFDLKRVRRTHQQARLGKSARKKNLDDAFFWCGENLAGKKIVLVDDVVASGSTLDAAAAVLKKSGAKAVHAVVFARGGKTKEPGFDQSNTDSKSSSA